MENLFRLVLTRPPVEQDEQAPSIRLAQDSDFQAALGQRRRTAGTEAMKAVAREFLATRDSSAIRPRWRSPTSSGPSPSNSARSRPSRP